MGVVHELGMSVLFTTRKISARETKTLVNSFSFMSSCPVVPFKKWLAKTVGKYIVSLLQLAHWCVLCAFDFSLRVFRRYNCTTYERQIINFCFKVEGGFKVLVTKSGLSWSALYGTFWAGYRCYCISVSQLTFLLVNPNLWDPNQLKFLVFLLNTYIPAND